MEVEIVNNGEVVERISMFDCMERFGTLPLGAQQRIRGTKPKVEREKLRDKRKTQRAARKKSR
jgi:hypothetical protein